MVLQKISYKLCVFVHGTGVYSKWVFCAGCSRVKWKENKLAANRTHCEVHCIEVENPLLHQQLKILFGVSTYDVMLQFYVIVIVRVPAIHTVQGEHNNGTCRDILEWAHAQLC